MPPDALTAHAVSHPSVLLQVYGAEKALPYVVPSPNVRIECPLALVDRVLDNRPPEAREAAHAFANFLFTPEAQVQCKNGPLFVGRAGACAGGACGRLPEAASASGWLSLPYLKGLMGRGMAEAPSAVELRYPA